VTYLQLQDDVLERINQDSSLVSSAPRTRVKRFINEWYRRVLGMPWAGRIRDSATTITTAAGTSEYTVTAASIRDVYDATNDWKLEERSLGWLRERDPGSDATGNPVVFVIKGRTATTLTVVLWPTPTAIATIKVDAEGATTELSANGDIPIIPVDFHHILADGALYHEYMRMGDVQRAQLAKNDIDRGMRELRVFLYSTDTQRLVPGRSSRATRGRSRLGSTFPEDW
jgi:hypothetical protein